MKRLLFLTVLCTGIAMFLASPVCAKVAGVCGDCHTMHNSQGGEHMMINTTIDGTSGGAHGGGYPSLTRGTCVGCHTGIPDDGPIPYVSSTSEPGTYLAGGNFYWATVADAKGHNVKGIPGMTADADLDHAPGDAFGLGCTTGCHGTLFAPKDGAVELDTGCQGCHLNPRHHAPQQANQSDPALEANGYFRFLSGHMSGDGYGVEGIEDSDWQYTVAAADHNEYLGEEISLTSAGGFTNILENTMTAYCTGCHGNFHTQLDTNSDWIRHPSDAVIPSTAGSEYAAYTVYDPIAPVARPDLTTIGAAGTVVPGTDMVMCLSCHRAHGSPNDDMLRWDYSGMVAGGGGADGTGCFVCHTAKDE
jgi:hypothetical protein